MFAEALKAGAVPKTVLFTEDDAATQLLMRDHPDIVMHAVADHVLKAASDTRHPQSPVAAFERPMSSSLSERNTVVLVDIADPGNVGTIIRTAAAFGWDVAVTGHTADAWSPKVLRSGAGAHFSTAIVEIESIEADFAEMPHVLVATVVAGGDPSVEGSGPIALLIGSEAHGLPHEVVRLADRHLTIPMPGGAESLNAAVAAGLGMWISTHGSPDG